LVLYGIFKEQYLCLQILRKCYPETTVEEKYKPPPRAKASKGALEQLRVVGRKALESQPLSKVQQEKVKLVLRELDALLGSGK